VPLAGIEPAFHPSQGCVLSIERQGQSVVGTTTDTDYHKGSKIQNARRVCELQTRGVQLLSCVAEVQSALHEDQYVH
jgi:hypothetical protein